MLIFSSHNPRAVLIIPKWNQQRVQEYARRAIGNYGSAMPIALAAFTAAAALRAFLLGAWISLRRTSRRLFTPLFWRGEGYMLDPAHGGLIMHYAAPDRVITEARQFGFSLCEVRGDDYPATSHSLTTDWYYYVFSKSDAELRPVISDRP